MMQTGRKGPVALWASIPLYALIFFFVGCSPSGPEALLDGKRLIEEEKYQKALRRLQRATHRLPENAQAWNHLGLAYHGLGETTNALSSYQHALRLEPDLAPAHFNIGTLHLEAGQPSKAIDALKRYTEMQPESIEGWLKLAKAQRGAGRMRGAAASYREVLKPNRAPTHPEALNGMGVLALDEGRRKEASDYFLQAVKHNPDYAPARLNLAILAHNYYRHLREERQLPLSQPNVREAMKYALARYKEYLKLNPPESNAQAVEAIVGQLERRLAETEPSTGEEAASSRQATAGELTNGAPAEPLALAEAGPLGNGGSLEPELGAPPFGSRTSASPANTNTVASSEQSQEPSTASTETKDGLTATERTGQGAQEDPPEEVTGQAGTEGQAAEESVSSVGTTEPSGPDTTTATDVAEGEERQLDTDSSGTDGTSAGQKRAQGTSMASGASEEEEEGEERVAEGETDEEEDSPSTSGSTITAQEEDDGEGATQGSRETSTSATGGETERWGDRGVTPLDTVPPWLRSDRTDPSAQAAADGESGTRDEEASQPELPTASTEPPDDSFPRYAYQSPSPPASGNRVKAQAHFREAVRLHRRNRFEDAQMRYRRAIDADPSYFEAHYNLGLVALQTNDLTEALRTYEEALTIRPTSVKARYNFGLALRRAGYPVDAARELEKVIKRAPDHVSAHLILGNVYADTLGRPQQARTHYRRVLELDPDHPEATAIRFWLAQHSQ